MTIYQNKIIVTNIEGTKVLCYKGFIPLDKLDTYTIRTFNTKYDVMLYLEKYQSSLTLEDVQCFFTKVKFEIGNLAK